MNNPSVDRLSKIPRLFLSPRTFSDQPEYAEYRPLLSTSFAFDYAIGRRPNAAIFQMDTFVWFAALLCVVYLLFRLIPGGTHQSGVVGAALLGLHPIAADTVNYVIRRADIMALLGISAGLVTWIVWPRRFPEKLPLNTERTPDRWLEEETQKRADRLNKIYRAILEAPTGLYLYPVVLAMLANPEAAVFAPILAAYIALFEPERGLRKAIPAAVVCGAFWVMQCYVAWRFSGHSLLPCLSWWTTQPWIAIRRLWAFLAPIHFSADTDLQPFAHIWDPLALAGFAGVALVVGLAIATARRERWRAVSFGIWWFLLALLPSAILPHRRIEADTDMFVPLAGLVFSAARTAWILWNKLSNLFEARIPLLAGGALICAAVLSVAGWQTFERNKIWESEETLWADVVAKNPRDGLALLHYANAMTSIGDTATANRYLVQAAPLLAGDAGLETDLAIAFDSLNLDKNAEEHFRKAIAAGPSYARAFSTYARWLVAHQRFDEALKTAITATRLEPADITARKALMDLYSRQFDWVSLKRVAEESARLVPDDPDAERSRILAQSTLDAIRNSESKVKASPTVDEYLSLSVVYFQNHRFEDCVNAARQALKMNPDVAEAYANMATAYHAMGKDEDAIAALRQVLKLNPNLGFAKSDLEYLLARRPGARDQP